MVTMLAAAAAAADGTVADAPALPLSFLPLFCNHLSGLPCGPRLPSLALYFQALLHVLTYTCSLIGTLPQHKFCKGLCLAELLRLLLLALRLGSFAQIAAFLVYQSHDWRRILCHCKGRRWLMLVFHAHREILVRIMSAFVKFLRSPGP